MLTLHALRRRSIHVAQLTATAALLGASALSTAGAQSADSTAILATVNNVFKAMHDRDTVLLRSVFDTSARLVGVSRRGTPALTLLTPARFGAAVVGAKAGDVWNERMINPEVRIDGNIAQVWGYYTFHLNDTFSHCGIDAFMLVKVGNTWKITQLADTERKDGCK
jgi:hypothetical protein